MSGLFVFFMITILFLTAFKYLQEVRSFALVTIFKLLEFMFNTGRRKSINNTVVVHQICFYIRSFLHQYSSNICNYVCSNIKKKQWPCETVHWRTKQALISPFLCIKVISIRWEKNKKCITAHMKCMKAKICKSLGMQQYQNLTVQSIV